MQPLPALLQLIAALLQPRGDRATRSPSLHVGVPRPRALRSGQSDLDSPTARTPRRSRDTASAPVRWPRAAGGPGEPAPCLQVALQVSSAAPTGGLHVARSNRFAAPSVSSRTLPKSIPRVEERRAARLLSRFEEPPRHRAGAGIALLGDGRADPARTAGRSERDRSPARPSARAGPVRRSVNS